MSTASAYNDPRAQILRRVAYRMKGGARICRGTLVALDAGGWAQPARDAPGLHVVVGLAIQDATNLGGDGAADVVVAKGVFPINTYGPMPREKLAKAVQIYDERTVRASGAANGVTAGILEQLSVGGEAWIAVT